MHISRHWTKHYTMTLWNDESELTEFAKSGAHLSAMKNGGQIAKEIRTITIDAEVLPSWDGAIKLLEKERVVTYPDKPIHKK